MDEQVAAATGTASLSTAALLPALVPCPHPQDPVVKKLSCRPGDQAQTGKHLDLELARYSTFLLLLVNLPVSVIVLGQHEMD